MASFGRTVCNSAARLHPYVKGSLQPGKIIGWSEFCYVQGAIHFVMNVRAGLLQGMQAVPNKSVAKIHKV